MGRRVGNSAAGIFNYIFTYVTPGSGNRDVFRNKVIWEIVSEWPHQFPHDSIVHIYTESHLSTYTEFHLLR
jgi:hypothetical protein